ncbi:MAG: DUF6092 family protein [Anaerolineae bacterium]|nr:DUF6092 family protein [Anaerolineae bacterium]
MANTEELRDELLLLVGFMLTSAHGLVDEPQSYGPARLLEAAGRLLDMMEEQGLLDGSLKEIKAVIDEERFGPMDEEGFPARLDQLALRWTDSIADRF